MVYRRELPVTIKSVQVHFDFTWKSFKDFRFDKKGVVILANNAFGIDLGTNNIKIYSRSDDSVLVEKNMIAIENKNTLFAYGDSAFEMYEKYVTHRLMFCHVYS